MDPTTTDAVARERHGTPRPGRGQPLPKLPSGLGHLPANLLPVDTYAAAQRLYTYAHPQKGKLASETYIRETRETRGLALGVSYVILHHRVPLLTFAPPDAAHPRGTVTVRLEGWHTGTTMSRVNELLPGRVLRLLPQDGLVGMVQQRTADPEGDRALGPLAEGATFDLLSARLLHPREDLHLAAGAAMLAENAHVARAISRLMKGLTDERLAMLEWDLHAGADAGICLICQEALHAGRWPRAHLLAHVEAGVLPREFVEYAMHLATRPASAPCRRLTDGTMVYERNVRQPSTKQRLRAHLRDLLLQGPLLTYYGRRRPASYIDPGDGSDTGAEALAREAFGGDD